MHIAIYILTCRVLGCGYVMLGSVDSYGHLIVSKLDASGEGTFFCFTLTILAFLALRIKFNLYFILKK